MEIGEIVGYMSHGQFSLIHVLVIGGPSSGFYRGKLQFWAKLSTRFGIGGLLFHNWEEYGKSKTMWFINDYLTIFTPNSVGIG